MKIEELGINVGQAIAGFVGSLIMASKDSSKNLGASFGSVMAGTASATYLTPIVADMLHVKDAKYMLGFAFLLGVLGLKGVELILEKTGIAKLNSKSESKKESS
jgi:hypothetical protein